MAKQKKINIQGSEIAIVSIKDNDFISLTDMVRDIDNGLVLIEKWLRNKNTIEFLGVWEEVYNPLFNSPEFEGIKNEAGLNRFALSVKQWVSKTKSIGIIAKAGRYGGTYAHKDIAFEFASWISPKFKIFLIKEFQRLKEDENDRLKLNWDLQRTLAKVNYTIHTDAIKEQLIPKKISGKHKAIIYATEADMLNVALFGLTAASFKQQNPSEKGNLRDQASLEQLVVLSNMESVNAVLIRQGLNQSDRLLQLNQIAITQMSSLLKNNSIKKLQ